MGGLPDRDPPGQRPPHGQTEACENITLPQTLFAGSKDDKD